MKALRFDEHGSLDVLRYSDVPTPEPGPGEVRVAVEGCSLNYHDIFTRRGMPGIRTPMPMVPGCDAAGRVESVGPDVDGWALGTPVLVDPLYKAPDGRFAMMGDNRWGGCAEYVVVNASQLLELPEGVSTVDASCLPVAYGTAHRMLFSRGRLAPGDTVLVLGASGGVGTACVLLAKMAGATVIAAAGSPAKCEALKQIGADETIDYTTTDFVEYTTERTGRLLSGGGWDVVVNFTGGDTWAKSLRCAKRGGRVLTCGATAGFDPPTDLRFIWTAELDVLGSNGWERSDLDTLLQLVEEGRLAPVVDRVLPLPDGVEAMRLLEDREVFGKVVVAP